jgi:hypothetical protein
MQKWEYLILVVGSEQKLLAELPDGSGMECGELRKIGRVFNQFGAEGWDLAGTIENGTTMVFKRPKQ